MSWADGPGGRWCVVKVNDDGRKELVRAGLAEGEAVALAGQMRDRCPDSDVADGWNFLPERTQRRRAA